MGKVFATCGHEVQLGDKGFGTPIVIWDYDREGERCQSSMSVCDECLPHYKDVLVPLEEVW